MIALISSHSVVIFYSLQGIKTQEMIALISPYSVVIFYSLHGIKTQKVIALLISSYSVVSRFIRAFSSVVRQMPGYI